jgi:uncharacterized membrane protein YhaH (DUF805 family)
MTLRTYLRFLRPVRSSLVIAVYTSVAFLWEHTLFGFDKVTSLFLALATALPLLLGIAIAGAAHEPMHRAFFLLLPDGPRHLRNATLLVIAVFAFAVCCAVAYVETSVPPLASLGLAAGLMALPCINRNRLGGIEGWLVAFCGWAVFNLAAGGLLRRAMMAAPWAFLLGGCAVTAASLAWGLSRRHLRQRAGIPFISAPSMFFSCLFHSRIQARWMDEVALYRGRRAKKNSPTGRDWPVRSVGSSTRAWMQVFWHAFAGRRRRNTFLTVQLTVVAPVIVCGLIIPLLVGFLVFHSYTTADYWRSLAALASPDWKQSKLSLVGFGGFMGGIMQALIAAFSLLMTPPPQLAYPISRKRQARVVFGLSLVQLASALVLPATSVFLLSLLGQIVSGQFLPGCGLPSIVAIDLVLAVGLPLLACAGSMRGSVGRILWAIPFAFAILAAVFTRSSWMPYVLTVPGVAVTALVASASVGLLWLSLRRYYRTCDLFSGTPLFNTRSYA